MKNFTNNFKQFTSRLSARWLIMALMLLMGISSAWGWTVIYDNTDTQWNEVYLYVGKGDWSQCDLKMTEYDTNLFIYNGSRWDDATEIAFGNASLSASTSGAICSKLKSTSNATYTYEKDFSKIYKYKASGAKGNNKDCGIYRNIWPNTNARVEVNTIKLAGSFNGWENSTDMCMTNGGSCSIDINLSAGTHKFKIILDGTWYGNGGTITKSIQGWEFKTSDGDCSIQVTKAGTYTFTFDVASKKLSVEYPPSCNTLPDDAYSLSSNSAEWTGSDITLNINKKDNNYPTPSIKYNDKSTLPKEVGEYIVVATVSGDATYCDKTFNLGTFTITCPTPAESPIYSVTQQTTSCKDTDNKIGIITLTNYNDAYTYQLNGEAVTVTNNQITDLAAGIYTISAAKTCGIAKSELKSGERVEITSTDLTPMIAKAIDISGDNEICAGESTELTCNVEASKGRIESYSWNQAGTKNGDKLITASLDANTNYVATVTITNDGCSKEFSSEPYQVTVNPVPSFTKQPSNVTLCSSSTPISVAELIAETKATASNSATIKLYDGNGVEITSPININTQTTTTYKLKASTQTCSSDFVSFTLTVNPLPNAPSLTSPAPVCEGTTFILPEKDDSKKTITWVGVDNRTLTGLTAGTHKYTAKIVEKGCESTTVDYTITVKEQLAKPTLSVTNVIQCGSNYTAGKIVISNHDPNNTYILKKDGNPINKAYNDGYSVSENEKGKYTVEVSKDGACGATSDDVTIEVINNTPTVTPFEITKQANVCMGNPVTLSYDGTPQSGTISYAWYEGDSEVVIGTESTLTIQQAKNASYKLVVTVTSNDCPASDEATTTVEPKAVPSAPTFDEYEMDACVNQQFTLPTPNNLKNGEEALWTVEGKLTTASQTIDEAGEYRYIAYKNDGCPSQGTPFTVRVNPLPTISISGNEKAVLYEDVMLAANATDGATVKWYEGGVEKATGATYVVTSETATSKAVTAKAFLNGCESDEASHTVKFSAEDCGNIGSNNSIIITCDPGTYTGDLYCYIFGATTPKGWSECKGTKNNGIWEWEFNNINEGDHSLIFHSNSKYDGKDCKTGNLNHKLQRGYQYDYALNGVNSNWCKEPHPTIDPVSGKKLQTISAPAVKTVSATSEEGSGIVTFTGKVLKTGCANGDAIWVGYQYKKANEAWPTTGVTEGSGVKQLVSISNNPGSEDFTVNVEGLENGNYHFRAYIINGYNFTNGNYDQGVYYGLDKLVTVSTTKTPISNVTLNYCDENGGNVGVDPNPMCKGAIAYVKLDYTGSKYSDIKWLVEGVETNLVTDEGDDVWSYEIQGDGSLSVELKNDANTDPAWPYSNKLPFEIIPEPTAPYISIDPASGIICEGSSATIKVENNPSPDCSYKLVKEGSEEEFPPYDSGDLTYTVQDVGKYYVIARHNECTAYEYTSNQVAINQIIRTNANISIDPAKAVTTPWEPVTITVKPDAGYTYELTYTDGNLAAVDGVRIKQNGDSYTYYIPRPDSWGTGDSDPVRDPINYGIKAQLKVDGEASECKLKDAPATIQLKDEDNENCPK